MSAGQKAAAVTETTAAVTETTAGFPLSQPGGTFERMSTSKGNCQTRGCENPATAKAQTTYDSGPRSFEVAFVVCGDCAEKIKSGTWPGGIEFPDLAAANAKVVGSWTENSISGPRDSLHVARAGTTHPTDSGATTSHPNRREARDSAQSAGSAVSAPR